MSRSAIIVAGGSGVRMGSEMPKQFLLVAGLPIVAHTLAAFQQADSAIELILVLPATQVDYWESLKSTYGINTPCKVVAGGKERADSVLNGLKACTGTTVGVHDGVRCLISPELIVRCFEVAEANGSAVPVVPLSNSIRELNAGGSIAIERSQLRAVQTPQCFDASLLRSAFERFPDQHATDEASLVELTKHEVRLVDGSEKNIKITTPHDLKVAESYLS